MKKALSTLSLLLVLVSACAAELPMSIQALIPRHANVDWHSKVEWNGKVAVFYYLPEIGGNDATKYIEFFALNEDGGAKALDRIYLGGRGANAIDKISENEESILIHAREHQGSDPISTPAKRTLITIKYRDIPVSVSKSYPKE
ncbi:MAG: hypothetical protein ACPGSB_01655 [Opitutales bacterium]